MIVTVSRGKESTYMKTFTIDAENHITVHPSRKAARETGAGVCATEEQFADLIGPDTKRLVEIWNGLTRVKRVTKFANRKSATERRFRASGSLFRRLRSTRLRRRLHLSNCRWRSPSRRKWKPPGPSKI